MEDAQNHPIPCKIAPQLPRIILLKLGPSFRFSWIMSRTPGAIIAAERLGTTRQLRVKFVDAEVSPAMMQRKGMDS
jgi:hypothetical protein